MSHPTRLEHDLALARDLAARAGQLVMLHVGNPLEVRDKGGRPGLNPVTAADLAVDQLLRTELGSARPGYGWLSEETVDDSSRFGSDRVWMVDPIDGTRALVDGGDEFAVSIGLLAEGTPVLGVIHHPPSATTWWGMRGGGAFWQRAGDEPRPMVTSPRTDLNGAEVAVGHSEAKREAYATFEARGARLLRKHSAAYKLALVAAGDADVYPCLRPLADWDIAAGVAILQAAGGVAAQPSGEPLEWNQPAPHNPGILAASSPELLEAAMEALAPGAAGA